MLLAKGYYVRALVRDVDKGKRLLVGTLLAASMLVLLRSCFCLLLTEKWLKSPDPSQSESRVFNSEL